ncbi:MAG: hypothetical protein HY455_02315 [Parcubacteria group bacterium]|nr:hypothetical protein [Parcubacteria group bacterium]
MSTSTIEAVTRFPTEQHVREVCKLGQGEKSCRYLAMGGRGGWTCLRAKQKEYLDGRVANGQLQAKGDNCEGVLGELLKNKASLVGKRVRYQEQMPTLEVAGVLRDLRVEGDMLHIIADWEGETMGQGCTINIDYLNLDITPASITMSISGLGSFAGITTIFLDQIRSR